ncbi:hypothetical protein Tco_0594356, partial [Tanacetum coccineum]
KQEEVGVQLNVEQADWKDDTDDESADREFEAHYMFMAQLQYNTLCFQVIDDINKFTMYLFELYTFALNHKR